MNHVKTAMLMLFLTALLIGMGLVLDSRVGGYTFTVIFFIISLGINLVSYWFSDRIVLALYRARPLTPQEAPDVHAMVHDLAARAEIPVPRLYIAPMDIPNAFATGRNPSNAVVCVTNGILNLLSRRELKGVLAHEISHVVHYDTLLMTVCAAIAGGIMFLSRIFFYSSMSGGRRRGGNPLLGLIVFMLAPILALMIQMAISRSREFDADAGGGRLSSDPEALASALLRMEEYAKRAHMEPIPATSHMFIVNPAVGKGGFDLFSTHPATEKRVARLRDLARNLGSV